MKYTTFLDANILFSAAYRENAGLLRLWKVKGSKHYSSLYAIEEATRNLANTEQTKRLGKILESTTVIHHEHNSVLLPESLKLRDKDKPILQAAIAIQADYLITGDFKDFGKYFNKTIEGVMVLPPADYFKQMEKV